MFHSEFFEIDERRLAGKHGVEQIAAHALQHTLCIEHFDNAALAEFVGVACGFDRGLSLAQGSGLKSLHLLIADLVLVVGSFKRRGHF